MARKSTRAGFSEPKTPYAAQRSGGQGGGEPAPGTRRLPEPETLPDGTVRYFLVLGPKGRVLFPADLRAAMGLAGGDVITAWSKDGEVRMHSHRDGLRKVAMSKVEVTARGGTLASDELIAERRAEAAKNTDESGQWLRERGKKEA